MKAQVQTQTKTPVPPMPAPPVSLFQTRPFSSENELDESPSLQADASSLFGSYLQRRATTSQIIQPKLGDGAEREWGTVGPVVQRSGFHRENNTGLPDRLKTGIETLSGIAMDDVRVHYNSPKPAQLLALAYTQGPHIHVAPRQERHLPHEAWHVVQQKQGRVKPTIQMKGVGINDDAGLEREADEMGAKAFRIHQNPLQKAIAPPTVQYSKGKGAAYTASSEPPMQRKILKQAVVSKSLKLAHLHGRMNQVLGFTPPTINFIKIHRVNNVVEAFKGQRDMVEVVQDEKYKHFTASVKTVPTNSVGYIMYLPVKGPWSCKVSKEKALSMLGVKDNGKNKKGTILLEITGPNGHNKLAKQIEKHEQVHAKDNEKVRDEILVPWDYKLTLMKDSKIKSIDESKEKAVNNLWKQAGGTLYEIGAKASEAWNNRSNAFHQKAQGKTKIDNRNTYINENQTIAKISYNLTVDDVPNDSWYNSLVKVILK